MYNMNTQKHSASRKTPYQIYFGIRPINTAKILPLPEDLLESDESNFDFQQLAAIESTTTQQQAVIESTTQQQAVIESTTTKTTSCY
jgi:hypothetical protein